MRFSKCVLTSQKTPTLFFSFDVENDLNYGSSTTISSKWNESGFLVDQAAAEEPMEFSLTGKIGYLVSGDTLLVGLNAALDMAQNRLSIVQATPLGGLLGPQIKAVSGAIQQAQTISRAVDNFATKIRNETSDRDRLGDLRNALKSMKKNKMLVELDSPLETFKNLIITDWRENYEDKTDQTLGISISLKECRFVELETANLDKALFATSSCRADIGLSPAKDMGQAATSPVRDRRTALNRSGGDLAGAINSLGGS